MIITPGAMVIVAMQSWGHCYYGMVQGRDVYGVLLRPLGHCNFTR